MTSYTPCHRWYRIPRDEVSIKANEYWAWLVGWGFFETGRCQGMSWVHEGLGVSGMLWVTGSIGAFRAT